MTNPKRYHPTGDDGDDICPVCGEYPWGSVECAVCGGWDYDHANADHPFRPGDGEFHSHDPRRLEPGVDFTEDDETNWDTIAQWGGPQDAVDDLTTGTIAGRPAIMRGAEIIWTQRVVSDPGLHAFRGIASDCDLCGQHERAPIHGGA